MGKGEIATFIISVIFLVALPSIFAYSVERDRKWNKEIINEKIGIVSSVEYVPGEYYENQKTILRFNDGTIVVLVGHKSIPFKMGNEIQIMYSRDKKTYKWSYVESEDVKN